MKQLPLKKYLAEGFLIVFSVLFALFINKLFDDYKTAQRKAVALEGIEQELQRNASVLKGWQTRHEAIREKIEGMVEGRQDSLKAALFAGRFMDLGILTENQALIDDILTSTAWEAAKTTGIISEFAFDTIQKLTLVYTMQDIITDKTLGKILDLYFDRSAHDVQDIDPTLIQFHLRFQELTGQERLLVYLYKDALEVVR